MILIKGCSNEVRRKALSDICPNEARPNGDTKYKMIPTNNCREPQYWEIVSRDETTMIRIVSLRPILQVSSQNS